MNIRVLNPHFIIETFYVSSTPIASMKVLDCQGKLKFLEALPMWVLLFYLKDLKLRILMHLRNAFSADTDHLFLRHSMILISLNAVQG